MSYSSNFNLNQRVSYLESLIGNLIPPFPTSSDLADVLLNGNSAGTEDIDMNNQDILQVDNIDLVTINGSAYPPVVGSDTLSQVLIAGNSAGLNDIDMNNQDILQVDNIDLVTINGSAYPPVVGSDTLQQVVNTGNGISNFVGGSTATITSTNFTNNRQLLLNANADPTIKMIDNLNSAHYTTLDIDTINLDGVTTTWSSIVAGVNQTLDQVLTAGNTATEKSAILTGVSNYSGGTVTNTNSKYVINIADDSLGVGWDYSTNLSVGGAGATLNMIGYYPPVGYTWDTIYSPNGINQNQSVPTLLDYTINTSGDLQILSPNVDITATGAGTISATLGLTLPSVVAFTNAVAPTCLANPQGSTDLCNKQYVDSQSALTAYQLYFNYSVPYTVPSGATYSSLSSTQVATPTTVAWTTNSTSPVFLGGFFNLLSTLNITSIPAGVWTLLLFANLTSISGQAREAFFYTIIGTASSGAETILYTSPASLLLNTVTPLIGSVSIQGTIPLISLTGYTGLGIKLYIQANSATVTTGSVVYQTTSAYSSILTSVLPISAIATLNTVLTAGNTATGANANITLTDTDVGGQANPILTLNNTNATGSVAMEVYKNKPTAGIAGDVLFNQSVYGTDAGLAKQEYTRISHTLRDATGGGEDGSIEFGCFVNGSFAQFLQINGLENEINFTKPIDMVGNNIRSSTGSTTITTALSTGLGNITAIAKGDVAISTGTGNISMTTGANINLTTTAGNINLTATGGGQINVNDDMYLVNTEKIYFDDGTGNKTASIYNNALTLQDNTTPAETPSNILQAYRATLSKTTPTGTNDITIQNPPSNEMRMDMRKNAGGGVEYNTIAYCETSEQFLLVSSTNNAIGKGLRITNNTNVNGSIVYDNSTGDGYGLTIASQYTPLELQTNSSADMTLTSGKDIIFAPNTSSGNIVFNGNNLQSNSSGGNSGEHLVIVLNGTTYKIALQNP